MSLDAVYFYADLPEAERQKLAGSRWGNDGTVPDYRTMAGWAAEAARHVMPDLRLLHVTDADTVPFDGFHPIRYEKAVSVTSLTYDAAGALAAWALHTDRPFVWTEPDSLFGRPVGPVFEDDFDIATVRRVSAAKEALPYTSGLLYVKPTPGTRAFFTRYQRVLYAIPESMRFWWCDMLMLALLLGLETVPGETVVRHGARVRLLPADEHLGVPKDAGLAHRTHEYYTLHFKGMKSKHLMPVYRDAILKGTSA